MIRKLTPRNRKWFRFVIIGAGFLLSVFFFFNWWFERNAVSLIKAIVERESHGQYKIDITRLRIHYFHPPRIELFNTQLHVYDSTGKTLLYDINVAHLGLQGKSLRNLVFGKKMLVDYIVVEAPGINIHTQHKDDNKKSTSISRQIGNITIFLQKLASMLEVKSLKITNGALGLYNLPPYNQTIQLTNLNFLVNNFHGVTRRSDDDTAFFFSDNIALEAGRQDITFPDKRHTLKFASLEISTQNRNIDIFDASLSGRSNDTSLSSFKIDIKRLHLINTDFNTLYTSDRIKVDSIYCHDPSVNLFLDASQKKEKTPSDTTAEQLVKQLVGDMDIKYVGFLNSNISVTTKNVSGQTNYATKGANLEFFGVKIKSGEYQASLVDRVNLSIKNYHAVSADSLYDIFLDSVTVAEKTLLLKNFRLMPSERNTLKTRRTILVPTLELRNISFYNLVFNKKLTATELILRDPSFTDIYTEKRVSDNNTGQSFGQILTAISKNAQVGQLNIVNGNLLSQSANIKTRKVEIIGMFMSIDTKQLLADTSFENLQHSVSNVAFSRAILTFPKSQFELTKGIFMGEKKMLTAETVRGVTDDKNFILSADNLKVFGYNVTKEFNKISLDSIQWSKANIQFHQKSVQKKVPGKPKAMDVFVKYMSVKNTHVDIDFKDGAVVKTDLQNLAFENFTMTPDRKIELSGLVIDGQYVQVDKPGLKLKSGEFRVHENQDSYINDLDIDYDHKGLAIKGRIPRMDMAFNLSDLLSKGDLLVSHLDLKKPELAIQITAQSEDEQSLEHTPKHRRVVISRLNINEAKVDFLSQHDQLKTVFGTANATVNLRDLSAGDGPFTLKAFDIKMKGYNINNHDSLRLYSENGELILRGSNLVKGTKKDSHSFKVYIAEAELVDANTEIRRKKSDDPVMFEKINLGVKDLQIDTLESHHIGQRLKANPNLFVRNINIIQKDEKNDMAIHGLSYVNGGHIVTIDSFHYHPAVDKETFNKGLAHEKDYIQSSTGAIRISQVDIEKLIADSTFSAAKIEIDHPWLSVYKDKHNPFDSSKYKPLPVNLLKKIKFGVDVDSLKLNNFLIEYTEWNNKTNKEAGFEFKNTNAVISNITNRAVKPNDSLIAVAYSRFLDTTNIRLQFAESYTDTLAAFYMAVTVSSFPLKSLNRFLPGIASAEIESGQLDTMRFNAIGREHLALGNMQFFYHDLKVRFLDKGNPIKKTFKTRIVTFLANNVLLRKKNESRNGRISVARIPYRGIFNYWIKITLSGILTSTGVKTNDRQDKKYQKDLKKFKVPEIADVSL